MPKGKRNVGVRVTTKTERVPRTRAVPDKAQWIGNPRWYRPDDFCW